MVPTTSNIAMPSGLAGNSKRYGSESAKLTLVAIRRAKPAETLPSSVSLSTKIAAMAAHMPPRRSSARPTNCASPVVMTQYERVQATAISTARTISDAVILGFRRGADEGRSDRGWLPLSKQRRNRQ